MIDKTVQIVALIILSIITFCTGLAGIYFITEFLETKSGVFIVVIVINLVIFISLYSFTKNIFKDFKKGKKSKTQWLDIEKYKDWQIVIYFILFSILIKGGHVLKKEYWPEIVSYNCNVQGEEVIQHYDLTNNKVWYWDNKKTSFSLDEDKHFYVYQIKAVLEELKNKGITATEFRLNTQTNNYTAHIIKNGVKEEYLKGSCKKIAE